jgi:cyclic pyranopterin phosphate synthase
MKKLTHIDARGEASMVDVSAKPMMFREAVASGEVRLQRATLRLIESQTIAKGQTGVEMEALTAVSVAGLTIYDMCKAVDKAMRVTNIRLVSKTKR